MIATSLVRFQIITILVGLALDKAISKIADPGLDLTTVLSIIYFVINALNFYHAKVVTTEDPGYKAAIVKPLHEIIDFSLNSFLMLTFLVIALFADQFFKFVVANIVMRITDQALIIFALVTLAPAKRVEKVLKAHHYWAIYNGITLLLLIEVILAMTLLHAAVAPWMPGLLVASALLDVVLDYRINWQFYFSAPEANSTHATG